jgi:hypothetical protein
MGEYAVMIAMVMAAIVAMTVYFKRAVQARIHDARDYMVNEVRMRTTGEFSGNLYTGYEPYYGNTLSTVSSRAEDQSVLLPGASSGIFQKSYNQTTSMTVESETAPPRAFDLTTPPPAGSGGGGGG